MHPTKHLAIVLALVSIAAGAGSIPAAAQSQPPSPLPGGASALQETYQDWRVGCEQRGAGKRCVLSQTQTQQNGQRVLAVELDAPAGNALAGTLVLPFGLALAKGATLQVDDKAAGQPLPFRTCLPGGCIVPLSFDAATIAVLKAGTALKVKTITDDGKEMPLSIPLRGFATALDRIAVLSR